MLRLPTAWTADAFANLIDPKATTSYGVLVPGPEVDDGMPFVHARRISLYPDIQTALINPSLMISKQDTLERGLQGQKFFSVWSAASESLG